MIFGCPIPAKDRFSATHTRAIMSTFIADVVAHLRSQSWFPDEDVVEWEHVLELFVRYGADTVQLAELVKRVQERVDRVNAALDSVRDEQPSAPSATAGCSTGRPTNRILTKQQLATLHEISSIGNQASVGAKCVQYVSTVLQWATHAVAVQSGKQTWTSLGLHKLPSFPTVHQTFGIALPLFVGVAGVNFTRLGSTEDTKNKLLEVGNSGVDGWYQCSEGLVSWTPRPVLQKILGTTWGSEWNRTLLDRLHLKVVKGKTVGPVPAYPLRSMKLGTGVWESIKTSLPQLIRTHTPRRLFQEIQSAIGKALEMRCEDNEAIVGFADQAPSTVFEKGVPVG